MPQDTTSWGRLSQGDTPLNAKPFSLNSRRQTSIASPSSRRPLFFPPRASSLPFTGQQHKLIPSLRRDDGLDDPPFRRWKPCTPDFIKKPRGNCKTFCHARMLLSGIHDFRQLQTGFPPRSVAGMTKLGILQLPAH